MAKVKFEGGKNLERILRSAGKGGVKGIDIGFFESARYSTGETVASVAAENEFGGRVPERPFFRNANMQVGKALVGIIKTGIDSTRMVIDARLAKLMGEEWKGQIQDSITDLKDPPNSPATIAAKGSDNPLIDTGVMRQSVTYEVR